jgi:hypothetical protein
MTIRVNWRHSFGIDFSINDCFFALLDFSVIESVYLLSIIFDPPLREARFTAPANSVDPLGLGWW